MLYVHTYCNVVVYVNAYVCVLVCVRVHLYMY